jgi:hypothetical protein
MQNYRLDANGQFLIEPDLLTFAFFCFFQGQKSNFQDTNGHVGK